MHCRRRKIRCEVAPDDPQGRCVDCIKLRKECKYYPVDQQPPAEKKSRPASRADTLPTAFPSTAASNTSGHRAEQPNTFFPHQAVSLSPGPGAPAFDAAKYVGNQVPFTTGWCEPIFRSFILYWRRKGGKGGTREKKQCETEEEELYDWCEENNRLTLLSRRS